MLILPSRHAFVLSFLAPRVKYQELVLFFVISFLVFFYVKNKYKKMLKWGHIITISPASPSDPVGPVLPWIP